MMSTDNIDTKLLETSTDLLGNEQKYKQALRLLLDWMGDRKDHHIAQRIKMGTSTSYLVTVSLGWIAENVYFARDLPLFKKHLKDNSKAININATTMAFLQQREIDHSRQKPMSLYLATREHHKFPPLLLVAYQHWAYDLNHDNWDSRGYATKASINVEYIDSKSAVVDLDVTGTHYFALDGQHRLLAIKGLKEILQNGRLNAKKRDGTVVLRKDITREEIERYLEEQNTDPSKLQGAMDEIMGIEIIPAVQHRETFKNSVSRLRNVFVDVNENAKRLTSGQISMLDENNGFRIVARTIMIEHRLFKGHNNELNVDTNSNQLSENSPKYTTLKTLVSITEAYLGDSGRFSAWKDAILDLKGSRGVGLLRPEDNEIEEGVSQLSVYFDNLATLPSHEKMISYFSTNGTSGTPPDKLRGGEGRNILFRPIAQFALARAIARLEMEDGANLSDIMEKISYHEELGELDLVRKNAPWFGILCDPLELKIRRHKRYDELCTEMFVYLLGGGFSDSDRKDKLRKECFEARRSDALAPSSEQDAWDFTGNLRKENFFKLPDPW